MLRKLRVTYLIIVSIIIATTSISAPKAQTNVGVDYSLPRSTPAAEGVNAQKLARLFNNLATTGKPVNTILIVKNGKIIAEAYKYPYGPQYKRQLFSVTKSIISILIGIAINDGLFKGVDEHMVDIFNDRKIKYLDERKRKTTLHDYLSMQAGIDWQNDKVNLNMYDAFEQMINSSDPTQYVLDLPAHIDPGTGFFYHNGVSHLLSAAIQKRARKSTFDYAQEKLFTPLGISDVYWAADKLGTTHGAFGLYLLPEDMAKIGQLMLNNGAFNNQQIVPAAWVKQSTRKQTKNSFLNDNDGYGYQWWVNKDTFFGRGSGGQYIIVVPKLKLVAVFCSNLTGEDEDWELPEILFNLYVTPAVTGKGSLAADKYLANAIAAYEQKPKAKKVTYSLPAQSIDGAEYLIEDNSTISFAISSPGEISATWEVGNKEYNVIVGLDGVERINQLASFSQPELASAMSAIGHFDEHTLIARLTWLNGADDLIMTMDFSKDQPVWEILAALNNKRVMGRLTGVKKN
ncbi:MAG: serine hydrolase [Deltaproteobacteria bacterium]|nr:serine hydrolase [Deltaproteobacteria bacterium]